jgi:GT2 family glycosyltransferase
LTDTKKKVVLCVPTITRPFQPTLDSIAASVPLLDAAGYEHYMVTEIGNPYISMARAYMLRKALDIKADVIVFIDHDVSWDAQDLITLIETDGDVVAGLYRFKYSDKIEYMGVLEDGPNFRPIVRDDGAVKAHRVPAGFLKVTRNAINRFMTAYPKLVYGEACNPSVDLFNHGAHGGFIWGEDYAFCRNWVDAGGEIWVVPNLNLTHHSKDEAFPGNYHEFLLRQPGGSLEGQ